ncbi:MAG: hypothetical protein MH204_10060, partial [Fimbriimonadaceae bacterium]|nr:hypothetical protein [Fimbriimonadaceae bacterium]
RVLFRSIDGARGILVNITSGEDMTLAEVDEAMEYIHSLTDQDNVNIIFGQVVDPKLAGEVRITVLATGFVDRPTSSSATDSQARTEQPAAPVVEPDDAELKPLGESLISRREKLWEEETRKEKEKDSGPAASRNESNRPEVRDVWQKASKGSAADDEEGEDLNVPAFLRKHQKNRDLKD